MSRGRPLSATPSWECQIHLRLRLGEDDDLIAFLESIPPRRRVQAIKSALRSGGMGFRQLEANNAEAELQAAVDEFLK